MYSTPTLVGGQRNKQTNKKNKLQLKFSHIHFFNCSLVRSLLFVFVCLLFFCLALFTYDSVKSRETLEFESIERRSARCKNLRKVVEIFESIEVQKTKEMQEEKVKQAAKLQMQKQQQLLAQQQAQQQQTQQTNSPTPTSTPL
jgi:hypothetical protein